MQDNKAFAQVVEFGRTLSQAHWEGLARKNISNKSFNSPLYAFYMKNKFGWADKTETINTNENTNVNLDELRTKISRDVADFLKRNTPELTDAARVIKLLQQEEDNDE